MKSLVFGLELVDLLSLLSNGFEQVADFVRHLLAGQPVLVLAPIRTLILAEYPMGGEALQVRAMVLVGAVKTGGWLFIPGH
jgi:hypothetical protein